MKFVLVGINAKYIHSNLAVRYLKAFTRELPYECIIKEFSINDRKERILEDILECKPEVVGFSSYIWNIEYVIALAQLIKRVDPKIQIFFGGPEVSYDCIEFLRENAGQYVLEGEGEETYKEFVQFKLGMKEICSIKGLYYKDENRVIYNGPRPLMDMNDIAFPYEEEENLEYKIVYYEASRGCPFNCKYCLSSTIHSVRFLELDRVKRELKFLVDKGVRLVKFVDRTFNCKPEFAMEVWKFLIGLETDTTFHFEISADILTKAEIKLLAKAPIGRFQFEVGVQTTNNTVLKNINRYVNFEHIKEKVEELERLKNIKQHLDLIAGLPGENFLSFKKSFNDVYSISPEEIQLGFLKLLKGSSMRAEAELWGMSYSPYPPYEILKTKDISYEELIQLKKVEEVVDKYYNSGKFNSILQYFIPKFKTPFDFYYRLGMFFHNKGYLSRSISNADYYKVFIEFNEEELKEENQNLREIIKYEYLRFNKKKWLPDFLNRDLDKELERKLREEQKKNRESIPFKNYHLENFKIDIFHFIHSQEIRERNSYLLFDEENNKNIEDVTSIIYKIGL